MKVGLLVGSLEGGGAERMMVNLAKGLSDKGVDVTLYIVNKRGPYLKDIPDHLKIYDYKAKKGVKSVIHKIRNTLKNDGLNAFISTQMHINAMVGLASLGLKNRPQIIFREANTPSEITQSYLNAKVYKYAYQLADDFVAVSQGVKDDMINFFSVPSSKVHVIYNPVVDDSISELMKEEVNHPWFIEEREQIPVIVGMGRISPQKGFEDLIEAYGKVRSERAARLVIFGDTNRDQAYYNRLTSRVNELDLNNDVEFAGFVNNPFKYLRHASLFVLSSKFEGLPGVLIQAMVCGCPVVSTDCPSGPREILEDGKFGHLVRVGDPKSLAQAMLDTISKPLSKKKLEERASFFSVDSAAKNYLSILQQSK